MTIIIYKEGCNSQNTAEGIGIKLLNGQKVLVYPKYSEKIMLPNDKIASWDEKKS